MTEIIKDYNELNWGHYIQAVRFSGAVILRKCIDQSQREKILTALKSETLREVAELDAPVRQKFATKTYRLKPNNPDQTTDAVTPNWPAGALTRDITDNIRTHLPQWRPNDAAIQVYQPGLVGIDPHRDYFRDKYLVVVASLQGQANFHVKYDTSSGQRWLETHLYPGDIVLLRGPGLTDAQDDRPYHQIDPPQAKSRISLGIRHNQKFYEKESNQ